MRLKVSGGSSSSAPLVRPWGLMPAPQAETACLRDSFITPPRSRRSSRLLPSGQRSTPARRRHPGRSHQEPGRAKRSAAYSANAQTRGRSPPPPTTAAPHLAAHRSAPGGVRGPSHASPGPPDRTAATAPGSALVKVVQLLGTSASRKLSIELLKLPNDLMGPFDMAPRPSTTNMPSRKSSRALSEEREGWPARVAVVTAPGLETTFTTPPVVEVDVVWGCELVVTVVLPPEPSPTHRAMPTPNAAIANTPRTTLTRWVCCFSGKCDRNPRGLSGSAASLRSWYRNEREALRSPARA